MPLIDEIQIVIIYTQTSPILIDPDRWSILTVKIANLLKAISYKLISVCKVKTEFFDRFLKFSAFSWRAKNNLQENAEKFMNQSKNPVYIYDKVPINLCECSTVNPRFIPLGNLKLLNFLFRKWRIVLIQSLFIETLRVSRRWAIFEKKNSEV